MHFLSDGTLLLMTVEEGIFRVDLSTQPCMTSQITSNTSEAYKVSPDEKLLACSDSGSNLLLYSLCAVNSPDSFAAGRPYHLDIPNIGDIMAFSPDSRFLAVGLKNCGNFRIYDLTQTPPPYKTIAGNCGLDIYQIIFSPDSRHIAVTSWNTPPILFDFGRRFYPNRPTGWGYLAGVLYRDIAKETRSMWEDVVWEIRNSFF